MGNKSTSNGINDRFKEFLGLVVLAIVIIWVILYLIYKLITEILIPILIGLFFIALGLALTTLLIRVLAHLFAYLTLERRCRTKLAALGEKISQLDAYISSAGQRIADMPISERLAAERELRQRDVKYAELQAQKRNVATALADHLSDKLDGVDRSRQRLSRKLDKHESDKLRDKLKRKDEKASLLGAEIERLKNKYYVEPDPAFERKERKYPWISAFDRFVASRFNGRPEAY